MLASVLKKLTEKFRPSPKPLATSEDATKAFQMLFESHGLPCKLIDGWVRADCLKAQARVSLTQHPNNFIANLELEIQTRAGQQIFEMFVGIGPTVHDAIGDSIKNCCLGSFHVLYAAVTGLPCSHCDIREWEIGGIRRKVHIGSLLSRGIAPSDLLSQQWCEFLFDLLRNSELPGGLHWIRFFHGALPGGVMREDEAMLDNFAWPKAMEELASFPWSQSEQYRSQRLFIMLEDANVPGRTIG